MNVYIYQADIYCQACGEAIRKRLTAEGKAPAEPDNENTYDSDDFPKGPYPNGGGEADHAQHCGSQGDCLEPLGLEEGYQVGKFLENPLTPDGEYRVRELHRERPTEITKLWLEHYGLEPLPGFRRILSSGREVRTEERRREFFVHGTGQGVSGPFPLNDGRFSAPYHNSGEHADDCTCKECDSE